MCKSCNSRFQSKNNEWVKEAYQDYSEGKQSFKQLKKKYNKSIPTFRKHFDLLSLKELQPLKEKDICLVFDTTKLSQNVYLMLFRACSQTVAYEIVDSEKAEYYYKSLKTIQRDFNIQSFTLDGRFSVVNMLRRKFSETPIQLCQFHFQKNMFDYTTRKPRTDCGKEIVFLANNIVRLRRKEFDERLAMIEENYSAFLGELNDKGEYVHKRLRQAIRSSKRWKPYLFTYQDFPELMIPNTTNSCEGFFSQLKAKLNVHSGLAFQRRVQMAISLLS